MSHNHKDSQPNLADKTQLSASDKTRYRELFVHRDDKYATQQSDGKYLKINSPLDDSVLFSSLTIGAYTLAEDNSLRWACFDVDIKTETLHAADYDSTKYADLLKQQTRSITKILDAHHVPHAVEYSGGRGYHVWIFFAEPVQASQAKSWLQSLSRSDSRIIDGLDVELFPKQTKVKDGGTGNCVKLPLQINRKQGGTLAHFVDSDFNPIIGLPEIKKFSFPEDFETTVAVSAHVPSEADDETTLLPIGKLEGIRRHCAYFRKLEEKLNQNHHLGHEERVWISNILSRFGKDAVHAFMSKCSDYDRDFTNQQLESLVQIPSVCASSPDCAAKRCPLMQNLGKESPITFAYRIKVREDMNRDVPWVFYHADACKYHYFRLGEEKGIPKNDLKNLVGNYGQEERNIYPDLHTTFDPSDDVFIDLLKHKLNYFEATPYMKLKKSSKASVPAATAFPHIDLLLGNLAPGAVEKEYVVNWLSTILNTRRKLHTAIVFKGDQGAGKNVFFDHILSALFGKRQCQLIGDTQLKSDYNSYMRETFFIAFNEVAHNNSSRNDISSRLKTYITESTVTINEKFEKAYTIPNHINFVFFSNMAIPIVIEDKDRRYTVIKTGPSLKTQPWFTGDAFIKALQDELPNFAQHLRDYAFDASKANTPLETAEKLAIVEAGSNRYARFVKHLMEDDVEWFRTRLEGEDFGIGGTNPAESLDTSFQGKIKRSLATKLFNALFSDQISTQKLTTELALYGISLKRLEGVYYFFWTAGGVAPSPKADPGQKM